VGGWGGNEVLVVGWVVVGGKEAFASRVGDSH